MYRPPLRLLRGSESAPLTPKAFDTLLALVERGGQVVEKDELMRHVWPDSFVEESNLTFNIHAIRKTLGESSRDHRYIVGRPSSVQSRSHRTAGDWLRPVLIAA